MSIITPVLIAEAYSRRLLRPLLILVVVTQLFSLSKVKAVDYFHRDIRDYDAFSQSTSTNNENLPKDFTYTDIADWQPGPKLLAGEGSINVQKWSGSYRTYTVSLTEPAIVVEPTMNFLGWETSIQTGADQTPAEYMRNQQVAGRIAYELPAGEHQVVTRFTQNTPARILGNATTLLTAAGVGVMIILELIDRKKHVKK
jgi:hypothetical protein